jgi:hypothetical protein
MISFMPSFENRPEWKTLSVPRGMSEQFNQRMSEKMKNKEQEQ